MDWSSFHLTVEVNFHLNNCFALVRCTIDFKNRFTILLSSQKQNQNQLCLSLSHQCFSSASYQLPVNVFALNFVCLTLTAFPVPFVS